MYALKDLIFGCFFAFSVGLPLGVLLGIRIGKPVEKALKNYIATLNEQIASQDRLIKAYHDLEETVANIIKK